MFHIVKFLNMTVAPLVTVMEFRLAVVPAQSMVRDLEIVTLTLSLPSAQEISVFASAPLTAVGSEHGADCVHALPEPGSEKNKVAAVTDCECKKAIANGTTDAATLESLMGNSP
jgi:hypothetical protein